MASGIDRARSLLRGLLPAPRGAGPLVQRDYWAVIARSRLRPSGVMDLVALRFSEFAPEDLVVFRRLGGGDRPLEVGDELEVEIVGAGVFRVRVVHRDRNSLTLATLGGHPEAGRITFGAYRNGYGDVIFHIRSRARSSTAARYLGYLAAGEPMQTSTWADFVNRVALTVGEGVVRCIHAERVEIEDEPDGDRVATSPTFIARGD